MTSLARNIYWTILLAVLVNSLMWLDSFETYLNSRHHINLSEYLPDAAYAPSRVIRLALARDETLVEAAPIVTDVRPVKIVRFAPVAPISPPLAETSPVSGSADQQTLSAETGEQQAVRPTAKPVLPQAVAEAAGTETLPELAVVGPNPKVLFAGDSMMQGVAPLVISRMRKDYPRGVFVDASKASTGLASRRYFDWPAKIREESVRHGIQVIVMFLGPNDPWDIFEGKKRYAFPSDGWEEKYRSRVDDVMEFAASSGIRVLWIGLPVMQDERILQGAKIENRIFQGEAEKYKFDFLPTDDILGSLDEPYTKYIVDPKKGKLAVRQDDGVHFTHLGLRMISMRIDAQLRKREYL